MKKRSFLKFFTILLIVFGNYWYALADPFASKLEYKPVQAPTKKKSLDVISYKGYAFVENQRYAFVEINHQSHMLRVGERAGDFQLLKITKTYLVYRHKGRSMRLEVEKDYK